MPQRWKRRFNSLSWQIGVGSEPPYGPFLTGQHEPRHAAQFLSDQDAMIHFFQVSLGDNLGLAVCRVSACVCMRERAIKITSIRLSPVVSFF